jgi:precorrin-2 methylase
MRTHMHTRTHMHMHMHARSAAHLCGVSTIQGITSSTAAAGTTPMPITSRQPRLRCVAAPAYPTTPTTLTPTA